MVTIIDRWLLVTVTAIDRFHCISQSRSHLQNAELATYSSSLDRLEDPVPMQLFVTCSTGPGDETIT